jgi:hypothetical protein
VALGGSAGTSHDHATLDAAKVRGQDAHDAEREAVLLLPDRRREALAAFAAPVLDDITTAGRGHARAEPVTTNAAQIVGLVRTLHDNAL